MPPLKTSADYFRFGSTLAGLDPCCSLHKQLARMGRQYLRLGKKLERQELARWRYEDHLKKYGADGNVIEIHR